MAGRSLPYRHTILSSDSWSFERARKYAHRRALTEEQQAEDRLARGLDIIHRAKHRGVLEHRRKRNGNANQRGLAPVLMRRHLSAIAIAAWEGEFGAGCWYWQRGAREGRVHTSRRRARATP